MHPNWLLRANARYQLGGSILSNCWLMLIVVYLIFSTIFTAAISTFIIGLLIYGPFMYGFALINISLVRGKGRVELEDLFKGFSEYLTDNILLGLLTYLFIFLWSLLFVIPGIVKTYSYAMVYYIKLDEPALSAKECIDKSRAMMDGYKMKLFLLDLSFIGWYLVGTMACGFGVLFVFPYHITARANFYESLKAGYASFGEATA